MKLRWTFVNILSLLVINCLIQAQGAVAVNVTVITQPDNTTTCVGGTAVFTCVMDILNVNISTVDIRWWRMRISLPQSPLPVAEAVKRYTISNSINEHRVTSVVTITDVRLLDMGPYWPGLTDDKQLCNMAFLSILENGSSTNIMNICPTVTTIVITSTTAKAPITADDTTTDTTSSTTDTITNTITTPIIITIITATVESTVLMSTVKNTKFPSDSGGGSSGGSSGGAIAGGVIGAILVNIIIVIIIIIFMYYFIFYRNKDNDDDGKSPYSVIASNRNGKNTLAVSNSVTYDEVHKTEAKTVPHQTTNTGELYAMSTKPANQDTHNEPSMLYAYARVDLDTKRKITEASVPHQTAADGVQYAVSTKAAAAAAKDDRTTDNDVNQNTESKEIKYADLQPLPTSPEMSNVRNESSSQYTQIVT